MINKRISKITMLTALFVAGVVNAQEFYTCVPKKSWWKDTIKESVSNSLQNPDKLAEIIANGIVNSKEKDKILTLEMNLKFAESQINNGKYWQLMYNNDLRNSLNIGIYKVIVAGGAGGRGSSDTAHNFTGGIGGLGEVVQKVFLLKKMKYYNACVGFAGESGGSRNYIYSFLGGGGGAGSAFAFEDKSLVINVSGGGGGGSKGFGNDMGIGGGGGYGCAVGGKGLDLDSVESYDNNCKYFSFTSGGKISSSASLLNSGIPGKGSCDDYKIKKEKNDYTGFDGGKECSKGGSFRNYQGNEIIENGSSCVSSANGNSGDGYVRIYKYIG